MRGERYLKNLDVPWTDARLTVVLDCISNQYGCVTLTLKGWLLERDERRVDCYVGWSPQDGPQRSAAAAVYRLSGP